MTPKEISRAAGKIFESTLPPSWAVRSQEDQEDYGIDYELEKTDAQDHATGFIFKAQQVIVLMFVSAQQETSGRLCGEF